MICRCGHGQSHHDHYRRGRTCALCLCERFRLSLWQMFLAAIR